MTNQQINLTVADQLPGREWPIGGLVFIRPDADLAEENAAMRGEIAVVVGPLGQIVVDVEDNKPQFGWVQKLYCPRKRQYLFAHPNEIQVLEGEPTGQGIFDPNV